MKPEQQIMHSFSFEVNGKDEAEIDKAIDDKMAQYLNDPADWTIVQKVMGERAEETMDGGRVVTGMIAEVAVVRVAGYVPWEVPQPEPSNDSHGH